ncbi:MAG: hypothetical protein Q8L48_33470 [Archangium sp.]|nr:hypothetical protein [Archangium sp.]
MKAQKRRQLSDFKLVPRRGTLATWTCKTPAHTAFGDFEITLQTDAGKPPDTKMLQMAEELVTFADDCSALITNTIHASYQEAWANDPAWVTSQGTPGGVPREQIKTQLLPPYEIVVSRHDLFTPPYLAKILLTPRWDQEHALSLRVHDRQIVDVNGSTGYVAYMAKD